MSRAWGRSVDPPIRTEWNRRPEVQVHDAPWKGRGDGELLLDADEIAPPANGAAQYEQRLEQEARDRALLQKARNVVLVTARQRRQQLEQEWTSRLQG